MSEKYCGVKFKTIFENRCVVDNSGLIELSGWCKEFCKMGFTPKYNGCAGNLSFRTRNGFIITSSMADFYNLSVEDFCEVLAVDLDAKAVYVNGVKVPSSETIMHSEIYKKRKDINAVFHGHSEDILKYGNRIGIVSTSEEKEAGSIELMREVVKVLDNNNFIIIKNHGFLSLGDSMASAGNLAIKRFNQIQRIKRLL